jgi:uncharacterized membrane protein
MIPKPDANDPFKNRRTLAYISFLYAFVYAAFTMYGALQGTFSAAEITALNAIPSLVTGATQWMYFDAVNKAK